MMNRRSIDIRLVAVGKTKGRGLVADIITADLKFSEPGDPGQIIWSLQAGNGALKSVGGRLDSYDWNELMRDIEQNCLTPQLLDSIGIDPAKYDLRLKEG